MRFIPNKKMTKLFSNRKNNDDAARKNEEQLHREKIMNDYDYIRSSVISNSRIV